jgi:hypothetical protein
VQIEMLERVLAACQQVGLQQCEHDKMQHHLELCGAALSEVQRLRLS